MTITLRTTKGSALDYTEHDDNFREILDLRRAFIDQVTAGGTADALTADFTRAVSLTTGVMVKIKVASTNTASGPTLDVNSTGAKPITGLSGGPLGAGTLPAGAVIIVSYDAGLDAWVAMNFSTSDALTLNGQSASYYLDYTNMSAGTVAAADLPQATTTTIGAARIATAAEAAAATLNDVFITPATAAAAASGGSFSATNNGYATLTGGIIIQWGTQSVSSDSTASITFPTNFPNNIFSAQVTHGAVVNAFGDGAVSVSSLGLSGMTIQNGSALTNNMNWLAIGN